MKTIDKDLFFQFKNSKGETIRVNLPKGNYFEFDEDIYHQNCFKVSNYIFNLHSTKKYPLWKLYKFASVISKEEESEGIDWISTFKMIEEIEYNNLSTPRSGMEDYFCDQLVELKLKIDKFN